MKPYQNEVFYLILEKIQFMCNILLCHLFQPKNLAGLFLIMANEFMLFEIIYGTGKSTNIFNRFSTRVSFPALVSFEISGYQKGYK